jgi:Tol biopolymer transport system component
MKVWPLIAIAALGVLAAATPAQASYPGRPGMIAYSTSDPSTEGWASIWAWQPFAGPASELLPNPPDSEFAGPPGMTEVSWAPSGRRFVFENWSRPGPHVYVTTGGLNSARELPTGDKPARDPAFARDGRTVAFVEWDTGGGPDEVGWLENPVIATIRTDGTRLRRLRPGNDPMWTPDGRRIAFGDGVGCLTFMRPDGSNVSRPRGACINAFRIDFSPDGRRIAYMQLLRGGGEFRSAIFVAGIDGRNRRRVTPPAEKGAVAPIWSPDGSWIVYLRASEGLYRVRPSGRGHARVAEELGPDLAWQPLR